MSTSTITEDQIREYLLEKLAILHARVPGHVTLDIIASHGRAGPRVTFSGYAEALSVPSIEGHSFSEIIHVIAQHPAHQSEAENLRNRAAKLLAEAARLDATAKA